MTDVTLPTNWLGSATIAAEISCAVTGMTIMTANALTAQLEVVKPAYETATSATLVSFGVDPTDADEIALGAGVYSNTFCTSRTEVLESATPGLYALVAGDALANAALNGMNGGAAPDGSWAQSVLPAADGDGASASNCPDQVELDVPNAIELEF
jgi:hypothetical protein